MNKQRVLIYGAAAVLMAALAFFALDGCGNREPEQRKAFIALLERITANQGSAVLEPLSAADKKLVGKYFSQYDLLLRFHKRIGEATEKNARELLALSRHDSLEAMAKAGRSLKRAANEAEKVRKAVLAVKEEADKTKAGFDQPEDLAAAYAAAYEKAVAVPAGATAEAFAALKEKFEADMDFIAFVSGHSMDMDIEGNNVNIRNPGLIEDVNAKLAVVREKAAAFDAARDRMRRTAPE